MKRRSQPVYHWLFRPRTCSFFFSSLFSVFFWVHNLHLNVVTFTPSFTILATCTAPLYLATITWLSFNNATNPFLSDMVYAENCIYRWSYMCSCILLISNMIYTTPKSENHNDANTTYGRITAKNASTSSSLKRRGCTSMLLISGSQQVYPPPWFEWSLYWLELCAQTWSTLVFIHLQLSTTHLQLSTTRWQLSVTHLLRTHLCGLHGHIYIC